MTSILSEKQRNCYHPSNVACRGIHQKSIMNGMNNYYLTVSIRKTTIISSDLVVLPGPNSSTVQLPIPWRVHLQSVRVRFSLLRVEPIADTLDQCEIDSKIACEFRRKTRETRFVVKIELGATGFNEPDIITLTHNPTHPLSLCFVTLHFLMPGNKSYFQDCLKTGVSCRKSTVVTYELCQPYEFTAHNIHLGVD